MGHTRRASEAESAVEKRIELFEEASPGKDLDERRLGLLLELARELAANKTQRRDST